MKNFFIKIKTFFIKIKDYVVSHPILSKALHTFYQAFIAVFVVGFTAVLNSVLNGDIETAKIAILSLLSASLAAGISALKTFILQKIK
jgi:hypothetical protein